MNPPPVDWSDAPYWHYLAAASVLTDFAADKLLPVGGGTPDAAKVGAMVMEHGEPIRIGPARGRWSLRGTSRTAALAVLKQQCALSQALAANRGGDHPDNPTQRAIDALLAGDVTAPLAQRTLPELIGLERAIELLRPAIETPPELHAQLIAQIERRRLLDPLERLLAYGFAGREDELTKLRRYVDELESASFKEMLARQLDNVLDIFRARPLLAIWGPGGVGKSTLIAKFLLEHAGPQQSRPTPFLYLDFDRGQLDPMQPDALLAEALRQMQVQFPDFAARARGLAADAATRIACEDRSEISRSAHFGQSSQLREQFAGLVREISDKSGSKVLLFVDTFEVVQRRGATPVFNVLTLVAQLVQAVPQLRAVIAGRAPLRHSDFASFSDEIPRWTPLPLEGFDPAAGRLYLQGRLAKLGKNHVDPAALARIVSLAQGNPLSLRLAAQVFSRDGVGALEDAVAEAEFDAVFTQERLQGVLHNRIVAALDEPLRKIADPGLIVRRLTPEVIEHVLAGPCNLTIATPSDAEDIFRRLEREVSLFERTAPRTLRHRPDVRLLMLPLLRAKLGDQARTIDEAAAAFWSTRDEPQARAEQIYHLLWLEADPQRLEDVWSKGPVEKAPLEDALDEFEVLGGWVAARLWLSQKIPREFPPELEDQVNLTQWERQAEQRARSLLASGRPSEALSTLRRRPGDHTAASPLWLLEIETLKLLGRDQEALALVDHALRLASGSLTPRHVLSLSLQKAWLLERASQWKSAFDCASRALRLALALGDAIRQFEAKVTQARLARRMGDAEKAASVPLEVARMLDNPTVTAALKARPALLGEAAAEAGALRPELFIWLSDRTGNGGTDPRGEASGLITLGVALAERGQLDAAAAALEQARGIGVQLGDPQLQARSLLQLADIHRTQRKLPQATACLADAMALAHTQENADLELQAAINLGNIEYMAGELSDAICHYEQSLAIARHTGNRLGEGTALGNLANSYIGLGDLPRAIQLLNQNLVVAGEVGDLQGEAQTLGSLATAYWTQGERARATELFMRSLEIAQVLGDLRGQSAALGNLGAAYTAVGDWVSAKTYLDDAIKINREIGDRWSEGRTLANLGAVYDKLGNIDGAETCLREAISIGEQVADPIAEGNALGALGALYRRLGRLDEAADLFAKQFEAAGQSDDKQRMASARRHQALVLRQLGQEDAASRMLREAEALIGATAGSDVASGVAFDQDVRSGRNLEVSQSVANAREFNEGLIQQTLI